MKEKARIFSDILKSGFVRSVAMRALAIFIIVGIIITAFTFFSFMSDLRHSILEDRQNQLSVVEKTISGRMDEIISIAYNIGTDPALYLEPMANDPISDHEMARLLERYLVGNSFIEHLAFCRTAEPDTIYTSHGKRSLSEFYISNLHMNKDEVPEIIRNIHSCAQTKITMAGSGDNSFFAYAYPLPQLSAKPLAHVLMLIPVREVDQLLETLLINSNGEAIVFDAEGNKIHSTGNLDDDLDLINFMKSGTEEMNYKAPSGRKYVLQKVVSETNRWTYVSVMRESDTLTGLANKQIAFIAAILALIIAAVVIMLASVIIQFKPISNLAAQVADKKQTAGVNEKIVDERTLLSDTIASLQDDSAQKQKYETAYYEAEAASKAKSAFLSSMSHDIRTPMNAIVGMTALARKHIEDQAYVDECLKKVQDSSDYLLDIINNVLDMSRIESGRIPITKEAILIPDLIGNVVSLMTSSVEAKHQTLEVDISGIKQPAVIGDNVHISQVFINILSNAVKFTPEYGKLSLKVTQLEADDTRFGSYTFVFGDTGIGIPPEFIGHVFDTFSRADGTVASMTEGTGLGMAIAKKLVELMDGTISCESELGKGTVFTVVMRMMYAGDEEAKSLAAAGKSGGNDQACDALTNFKGKRILLVEDNMMNREIARRIIIETGIEVVEASNGKEALDAFTEHPEGYFDLIFMDIQMPVMNGYEAAAGIRSSSRADAKTVPIYAMTANTFDEDVRRVEAYGMNGHIGKPYTPPILYHVLNKEFQKESVCQ